MKPASLSATPKLVKALLQDRIRHCQHAFLGLFVFTLILNVILSHYSDPTQGACPDGVVSSYGVGSCADDPAYGGNYTISHSMTGKYSKTFALALIFLCNLYYFSISHYQFAIYKVLIRYLHVENAVTEDKARTMWKVNSLAYGIATWSAIFLQCLVIFDAQRFNTAHLIFAGLFFNFCLFYVLLMMRNDSELVALGLSNGMPTYNKIVFAGMILFMIAFIIGSVWDYKEMEKGLGNEAKGKRAKIMCAFGEYMYMVACVVMMSSATFARESLMNEYDFTELLNVKLFSVRTLLIDCATGGEWRYIFGEDLELSEQEVKMTDAAIRNYTADQKQV